ncbi:MAG: LPS export ABC transporter periplasmic protein LptC [Neisseriaceae bacterium]
MKTSLPSFIFPLFLITVLSLFTLWVDHTTIASPSTQPKPQPLTAMYNTTITSFNKAGLLENKVTAQQITQAQVTNFFFLTGAKITHYTNNGQQVAQQVTAKKATYRTDTKEIKMMGDGKGKVEIIINEH